MSGKIPQIEYIWEHGNWLYPLTEKILWEPAVREERDLKDLEAVLRLTALIFLAVDGKIFPFLTVDG